MKGEEPMNLDETVVTKADQEAFQQSLNPDTVTVVCDRCKKTIHGMKNELATGGFYEVGPTGKAWGEFANPGENIVCDDCMWHDPRYIAVHGKRFNE